MDWSEVHRELSRTPAEYKDPKFYALKHVVDILGSADPQGKVKEVRQPAACLAAPVTALQALLLLAPCHDHRDRLQPGRALGSSPACHNITYAQSCFPNFPPSVPLSPQLNTSIARCLFLPLSNRAAQGAARRGVFPAGYFA